ncbi:NAM-associated domain-containing protein [Heracleum sosnowskyi]|uniref:NAM-associated domain-containing protein n=1 Tax=Heracleum sosnowskyi TaxID=360622 RepID=A0AAD8GRK4_9APIA|nr:NAM-associated domain-containing protein [Heracleum sosnowskyi]
MEEVGSLKVTRLRMQRRCTKKCVKPTLLLSIVGSSYDTCLNGMLILQQKKSKARKESSTTSSPSTPDCVVLEKSEFQRPIGRKTAKEMEKKRKRMGNEYDDNGSAAILEQMRADQLESRKQRNEHLQEMIQLAKERENREKRREAKEQDEADAKIMAMDTSSMGDIEVEYFNSRKREIIERRRAHVSR